MPWLYDALGRLTGTTDAKTAVDGRSYTWDAKGTCWTASSTTGLVWNVRYDGDGVRLAQVVNGQPITYTLDLAAPLVTVLAEQEGSSQHDYLYGIGDSPVAGYDGSTWTFFSGRDSLNSVRQETDAAGRVLAARSFDPYGVPLSADGGAPFGYTGEYRDEASHH